MRTPPARHKVSISGTVSEQSHHHNPLNLVVPTEPTNGLSSLHSFSRPIPEGPPRKGSLPHGHNCYCSVCISQFTSSHLLRLASPHATPPGWSASATDCRCPPSPPGSQCIPTPCFSGSARPGVGSCTTSTYRVHIRSLFKTLPNVK